MSETPEQGHESLEEENARLKEEIAGLRARIEALETQGVAMAALYRGATPTEEGRRAHAEITSRVPDSEK